MFSLTKKYNRNYYRGLVKIKFGMYWKLFKLYLVGRLIHLAYWIDYDMCVRLTGKHLSPESKAKRENLTCKS